jgi:acyl-[acyl carrier protein]--UDP-N-acetylglucosamine O-acyltransferase
MSKRLSDYFGPVEMKRDGTFEELGHADSVVAGTLAYCDTVHHLAMAGANPCVSCVLTTSDLAAQAAAGKGVAVSVNPRNAFYRLHERLDPGSSAGETVIHPSAIVSSLAKIGRGVVIAERVVIMDDVVVGDHTFIDAGAILGAEGLLYIREDGNNHRIRHRGGVRIGKHVTILANAVVVRAIHPGQPTRIDDHSIVGIASTIGHEASVGRNCVISGNSVIARRAIIGDGAWVGSSTMVREYVHVGAGASVKAGSVVVEDVPEGAEVSGNFAVSHTRRMMRYLKEKK